MNAAAIPPVARTPSAPSAPSSLTHPRSPDPRHPVRAESIGGGSPGEGGAHVRAGGAGTERAAVRRTVRRAVARGDPARRTPRRARARRPHRDPAARDGHVPPLAPGGHPLPARARRDRPAHPHRLPRGHGPRAARGRPDERQVGPQAPAADRPRDLHRGDRPLRDRPERRVPDRLPTGAGPRGRGRHSDREGGRPRPLRRRGDGPLLLDPDARLRGGPDRRAPGRRPDPPRDGLAGRVRRPHGRGHPAHRTGLAPPPRDPRPGRPPRGRHGGGPALDARPPHGPPLHRLHAHRRLRLRRALRVHLGVPVRHPGDLRRLPADLQPAVRRQLGRAGRGGPDQRQAAGGPGLHGQGPGRGPRGGRAGLDGTAADGDGSVRRSGSGPGRHGALRPDVRDGRDDAQRPDPRPDAHPPLGGLGLGPPRHLVLPDRRGGFPLVGIAGEHTAVPMAVVQLVAGLVAVACFVGMCRPWNTRTTAEGVGS